MLVHLVSVASFQVLQLMSATIAERHPRTLATIVSNVCANRRPARPLSIRLVADIESGSLTLGIVEELWV